MIDPALVFWMVGISVAHGLRFVVFNDPDERKFIAMGGVVIYALAALLAWVGPLWGAQAIAVGFPIVGFTLVKFVFKREIDNWQLAVGVTQFSAMLYVLYGAWP